MTSPANDYVEMVINLDKYRSPGVIVLSGRPKGEALRENLNLDVVDQNEDLVRVTVGAEVVSLNSSFFLGLFSTSVQTLGEPGFRAKYAFDVAPEILEDVEEGITQALRESNPLPAA